MNAIFAITAVVIEWSGISLNMYFYADHFFTILDVPLIVNCLLGSHRSHVVDCLQEIRLDRWASDRYYHRLTSRILSLSSKVVDMDS